MKAKIMVMALAIAFLKPAFGQVSEELKMMEPGHYYVLSRQLAEKLSLDYDFLVNEFQPTENEFLAVKVDEENQIDVSIFDNTQFSTARSDIVQQ